MADVSVPPPPPPPPPPAPGNAIEQTSLLGDSILTPNQSGTSLLSLDPSETSSVSSTTSENGSGKRAATIGELRESAGKWSLAGDAGILLYFKQFSQNMLRKTHELEKVVDNLAFETKGLDSKVHNTFNDFLMLSNKQFIENRVYDEEVSKEDTAEKEPQQSQSKTREQLEAEILPRFSQAVNLGFQVLEDAFITVELKPTEESDDEDEEGLPAGYVPDPIIEPKDMYASRPLPHLIGTAEFFNDETLGLVENDDEEDEEKNDNVEDEDVSESESESEEEESDYTESSDEEEVKKPAKGKIAAESDSEEESDDSDGDLFGKSADKTAGSEDDGSESEENEGTQQAKPKLNFQAELASKIGGQGQTPSVSVTEVKGDTSDAQSISSRKSVGETAPANDEDAEKLRTGSVKKERKHRSSSKRSESKGSKHGKGSVHESEKHSKHHHKKQEEESDEDLFGESKDKFEDDSPFGKKSGMFSGGGTLFDSEPGGGLFGDVDTGDQPSSPVEESPEPQTPTEIKPRTKTTSSGKKIPAGAVSLFGDADLFGSKQSKDILGEKEAEKGALPQTKKPQPIVNGLFSADEDDELFETTPKKDTLKEPPVQKRKKTLEMFDENEDSLFGTAKSVAATSGQPSKGKEEEEPKMSEGLFGAVETKAPEEKSKVEAKRNKSKPKAISLFEDDEEEEHDWLDNIDPSKNKTPSSRPKEADSSAKEASSLFGDSEIADTKAAPSKQKGESKSKSKARARGLFDEDENEDEDLFSTKPPVSSVTKVDSKKSETKKQGGSPQLTDQKPSKSSLDVKPERKVHKPKSFLGDDENGLFGDDQDDLFTAPAEKRSEKTGVPSSKSVKAPPLDVDEEDGLFKTGSQKSSGTKQKSRASEKTSAAATDPERKENDSGNSRKKTASSLKGIFGEDVEEEEASLLAKSEPIDQKSDSGAQKGHPEEEEGAEEEPVSKAKRLPGAVSMFGGINPFEAKKNLRSPSKEKVSSPTSEGSKDDDLFSGNLSRKSSKPAVIDAPTATPATSQAGKLKDEEAKDDVKTSSSKNAEEVKASVKPKIAFNPATLLPGAAPPPRTVEPTAASFENPPDTQILTNPNKNRARIQTKRRPPTRQVRQNSSDSSTKQNSASGAIGPQVSQKEKKTTESLFETDTDRESEAKSVAREATSKEATPKEATPKEATPKEAKPKDAAPKEAAPKEAKPKDAAPKDAAPKEPAPKEAAPKKAASKEPAPKEAAPKKAVSKEAAPKEAAPKEAKPKEAEPKEAAPKGAKKSVLTASDIFTDDGDDLFATSVTPVAKSRAKTKQAKERSEPKTSSAKKDDLFSDDLPAKTKSQNKDEETESKAKSGNKDIGLFFDDSKDNDVCGEAKSPAILEEQSNVGSEKKEDEKTKKSLENGALAVETDSKILSEDEDLFESLASTSKERDVSKDDVKGTVSTSKTSKKGKEDAEKLKKKKEKANIFQEGNDDDLFTGKTPKKEGKKTSKASKTATDDDLFGDSGSIFNVPSKSKEKKKKKAESRNDEDIFATGGEKKAKPKKKVEKTSKTKTTISQASEASSTNIFDDPLNALGGE